MLRSNMYLLVAANVATGDMNCPRSLFFVRLFDDRQISRERQTLNNKIGFRKKKDTLLWLPIQSALNILLKLLQAKTKQFDRSSQRDYIQ